MASTHKSLRSGTANKRPTTSIADGQIALNTNAASPGLYFKDSTGASIIKIGPVHVGTTAPNVAPAGSSGNSTGEAWLDTSLTPNGWKVWTGAAWTNATPVGSDTVQGLLELATNAETQAGSDTARAVTPAGLQSKVSDSTSTTSSTTIASSTAVKSAYDLANAALPKSGGTVTGNLEIGTSGSLTFEGATADAFETTLAVVDPTADRTITLPNVTGTVVTTGDTGTVTSTMILDGTILNADVNASAAIAGTKISPDFGSQNAVTTGTSTAASFIPTSSTVPTNGVYLPAANNVAISTAGSGRLFVDASGNVGVNTSSPSTYGRFAVVDSQNGYVSSTFTNTSNGSGAVNRIQIGNDASPGSGQFVVYGSQHSTLPNIFDINNANNAALRFLTNNTERLRITSSGLVGVGTSSPTTKLEINGGTDNNIVRIVSTDANANIEFADNTTTSGCQIGANGDNLKFGISGNEAMRIDSSGRLGIGTTSPLQPLHVKNAGSTACRLVLENSGSTAAGSTQIWSQNNDLVFDANSSERARIDSSGRLGVGTSNVLSTVQIVVDSPVADSGSIFTLASGGGNLVNKLNMGVSSANNYAFIQSIKPGYDLLPLLLNPSGGRVGIGTTSPDSLLDCAGGNITLTEDTNVIWKNAARNTNRGAIQFDSSGNLRVRYGSSLTEGYRLDSSGRLLVGTSTAYAAVSGVTPSFQLQGTGENAYASIARWATGSVQGGLIFNKSRGASVGTRGVVAANDGLGEIAFAGDDGTNFILGARIEAGVDGTPGANDMPTRLMFSTTADGASAPTERMRIDSAGNTYIKVMQVGGTANVHWSSSAGQLFVTSSSLRFKNSVEEYDKGLAEVMQMQPKYFVYNQEPSGKKRAGFIAEDFHDLGLTEYVEYWKGEEGEDLPSEIGYSNMVAILVKAIQELKAEVDDLKSQLA
jgi:hypothetical protein